MLKSSTIIIALLLLSSLIAVQREKTKDKVKCPVIGIDLGTTFSAVAMWMPNTGTIEIIENKGKTVTPSYVSWSDEGRQVGQAAKNLLKENPMNTVYNSKRQIGRDYNSDEVQQERLEVNYVINKGRDNNVEIQIRKHGKQASMKPEQISAYILTEMKKVADTKIEKSVTHAVVTVPAYFGDSMRTATKNAGIIAKLNIVHVLNEPTAAALAFGLGRHNLGHILVYDLGGGTFDVSILTHSQTKFDVLATHGDTHLGGEDFDQNIIKEMFKRFKKNTGVDASNDYTAKAKLKTKVEDAKKMLSVDYEATIEIENFSDGRLQKERLTRTQFENQNKSLFDRTMGPLKQALMEAKLRPDEINEILMVGGSTRIPMIQKMVKEFFGGKELNERINPDEAVAKGAAIYGSYYCGATSDKMGLPILDITPLDLGIRIADDRIDTLLSKGTKIPAERNIPYTTEKDYVTEVGIEVYEGDFTKTNSVRENTLLNKFVLKGIKKQKKGEPKINITFKYDESGIIIVSAKDMKGGNAEKQVEIKPTNTDGLSVQEMIIIMEVEQEKEKELALLRDEQTNLKTILTNTRITMDNNPKAKKYRFSSPEVVSINEEINFLLKWMAESPEAGNPTLVKKKRNDFLVWYNPTWMTAKNREKKGPNPKKPIEEYDDDDDM